jgi:vacuolar protein sorting-associated protein 13A/C
MPRISHFQSLEVRQLRKPRAVQAHEPGSLQFHGLHLKKTLLERFGLPVDIVAGDIGNLSVSIPWTQLKNQPVKIVIDDVYILARARPQGKVDLEEDARIEQATKQEKLKSAEAVDNAASQVGAVAGDEGMSCNHIWP